ncbi:MAG: hypothetical protein ABFC81_06250, partial [Rectinema sp.]
MSLKGSISSTIAVRELNHLREDPARNFPQLVDWARRLDVSGKYGKTLDGIASIAGDENNNWNRLVMSLIREIDPSFLEKFITNFAVNSAFLSIREREKIKAREGCNIPWAILMDPTAA